MWTNIFKIVSLWLVNSLHYRSKLNFIIFIDFFLSHSSHASLNYAVQCSPVVVISFRMGNFVVLAFLSYLNSFNSLPNCLFPSFFPRAVCIRYHGFSFFPMNLISALCLITGVILVHLFLVLLN